MLYLRAEQEKLTSSEKKIPNPFYLVYCFSRYECQGNPSKISELLKDAGKINELMKRYTITLKWYYAKWVKANPGREYNDMIKAAVDNELLDECKSAADDMISMLS